MFHARCVLSFLLGTLGVGGCTAAYVPPPLPVTHPANPAASEAPPPPSSHALTQDSLSPTSREERPALNPHEGHGAMPGGHQ